MQTNDDVVIVISPAQKLLLAIEEFRQAIGVQSVSTSVLVHNLKGDNTDKTRADEIVQQFRDTLGASVDNGGISVEYMQSDGLSWIGLSHNDGDFRISVFYKPDNETESKPGE